MTQNVPQMKVLISVLTISSYVSAKMILTDSFIVARLLLYSKESFVIFMKTGDGKDNSNRRGYKRLSWSLKDKEHESSY